MAISKTPKNAPPDLASLQSDVATFASSLGLAPSLASGTGFDDSDFRKPHKPVPNPNPKSSISNPKTSKPDTPNPKTPKHKRPNPLQVSPFENQSDENQQGKISSNFPLMKPSSLSGNWYVDSDELETRVLGKDGRTNKARVNGVEEMKKLVERKKELGERLMKQYTKEYEEMARKKKSGDLRLLEATARSGTTADKVSAFACLVEDNPIANIRSLDALLSMVTSKVGKRYAFTGFDALKELFLSRLLPDCKLKSLFQRPLDVLTETKDGFSLLLFWYWEECLKQRYEKFVIALEEALKDMLPNLKDRAMKTVFVLLKSKSEQERRLLSALVNKLGDPESKAASGAVHHLSCLLNVHPNMKGVVIDEVDSFIFRPHIGLRAKYHAVIFLNQICHSKRGDGPNIAKRLVDVYFALFKVLISESHDNRTKKEGKADKRKAGKGKNKGKKEKYSQKKGNKESSSEMNFEMDSRLLSALLTGVNRAFPYVSSDEADDILEVQTPILFKLVHSANFNVGVQALMLLYQISTKNQIASDRFYRALYAKLLSPAAVSSSKPELFIGLLTKAMKNDLNLKRIAAFSKRLLQVALQRPPQYACGCLFLLSQVLIAKPPLWAMVLQNESIEDDVEHFEDIVEDPEEENSDEKINPKVREKSSSDNNNNNDNNNSGRNGAGIKDGIEGGIKEENKGNGLSNAGPALPAGYNPRHREPSYCNGDRAGWWELTLLASHLHPSVATMARTLLSGAPIVYNGNPLSDLSLIAFLDKFMEKKPKHNRFADGKWHGGSQIAPTKKLDMNPRLIGEEILQLAEDEVPPEDLFFHQYYMNKSSSSNKKAKKKKAKADDEDEGTGGDLLLDEEDEEEDEEEMDRLLGAGPHLSDGEDEYDYDDLDRVAGEEDDDLLGNGSDVERGGGHDVSDKAGDDVSDDDVGDDDDGDVDDWLDDDRDDGADDRSTSNKKNKKNKRELGLGGSPFASLEDYEHLLLDESKGANVKSTKRKGQNEKNDNKSKSKRKKRSD